jgi:hypothetical protein
MEEVDNVQLVALASAGVSIPKSVKSARDFTPEALHSVLVSSLRIIAPVKVEGESKEASTTKQEDGDDGMDAAELAAIALAIKSLPDKLPGNVAVRHRVATAVSNVIRQLGFAGEGGYNQLLYPAERDVRRLLSWVLQKLPRADDGLGSGGMDPARARLFKNLETWMLAPAKIYSNQTKITPSEAAELASAEFSLWKKDGISNSGTKNTRSLLDSITASLRAASSVSSHPSLDGSFILPLSPPESLLKAYSVEGGAVVSVDILRSASLPTLEQVSQAVRDPGGSHINIPLRRNVPNVFPGSLLASYPSSFQRRAAFTVELVIRKAAEKRDLAAEAAAAAAAAAEKDSAPRAKTEEEILREREDEVEKLQADADALQATVEALASRCQMLSAMLPQLRAQQNQLQQSTAEIERAYLLRKSGLEMLPDAGRNIERLTAEIEGAASRLLELGAEWEKHRVPLVSSIAEEELRLQNQEERAETKVARVKEMKQQIVEMGANYSAKEELEKRLTAEYAKVQQMMAAASNGGGEGEASEAIITRPVYTRRILDVVRQIRKQKSEIGRIVGDVRKVNAELAAVSEKVKKNAASATEMIDRAATLNAKDQAYRQALKQVVALQDAFNAMLKAVSDAGAAENEMRDIENRIEQMQQRNDEERAKEIERDTLSISEENKTMTAQLGGK